MEAQPHAEKAKPASHHEAHGPSSTDDEHDPWNTHVRTPDSLVVDFWDALPDLLPVLDEDNVKRLLDLFRRGDTGLAWGFIITPVAFTQMVKQNALHGFRANPNCINRYGYFPLHEAAETFSVDMIRLLLRYKASANVRTAGAQQAVENTCLHKYLEDNAFLRQEDLEDGRADANYVCKLIHLLCLPEMKIFLDTTRLLGEHTDNLMEELCNYVKEGRLVESAILLLATQKQIRRGLSCNRNCRNRQDGFYVLIKRVLDHIVSFDRGQSGKENGQLMAQKKLAHAALLLVHAVSRAGEDLDAYIRSHPEVRNEVQLPHNEVTRRVSSILEDHGFGPAGEDVDIGNLSSYEHELSEQVSPDKRGDIFATKAAPGIPCQHSKAERVARKNGTPRGWGIEYARR